MLGTITWTRMGDDKKDVYDAAKIVRCVVAGEYINITFENRDWGSAGQISIKNIQGLQKNLSGFYIKEDIRYTGNVYGNLNFDTDGSIVFIGEWDEDDDDGPWLFDIKVESVSPASKNLIVLKQMTAPLMPVPNLFAANDEDSLLTDWYEIGVYGSPVRVGIYKAAVLCGGDHIRKSVYIAGWYFWNGENWGEKATAPFEAFLRRNGRNVDGLHMWQGLSKLMSCEDISSELQKSPNSLLLRIGLCTVS